MDSPLNIELNRIMQIVLETIRINRSTTVDVLLDALKLNYPNVNTIHLQYKLNKVIRELKNENVIHEIKKHKIDFGQNVHCWTQNMFLIDLNIIQCLKVLDKLLSEINIHNIAIESNQELMSSDNDDYENNNLSSDDLSEESNCENDIEVINNYNEHEVAAKYLTKPDSF
ncbi:SWI5-dependent HO expression protein 3-like [Rhopalosiphum maidis]|uniref:SWI5-dependent HO expression protein 3-like n=1 Tax=Rhopalosiphum maidis TaxID=43146 RepID=UPI00101DC840|nr:SWI5-dependent HO expression protein 3-like [Rhopalosiphum maidis]